MPQPSQAAETSHFHRLPAYFWVLLGVLAAAGCAAILLSTPYGLGLVNDSAAYVGGAWNLVEGHGYVRTSGGGELKPLTHFPPLFSLLLAGVSEAAGALGLEIIPAARVVIALLFGLSVVLVGLVIYRMSRSTAFALFGAFLFLVSDTFLDVYVYLLSEPLFLVLLLGSFLFLYEYMQSRRWTGLLGVGALIGLASLTRYVGLSLLVPATLVLWVYARRGRPLRKLPLRETVLLWASSLLPILVWALLNRPVAGETVFGNRTLAWHPIDPATLLEAVKNLLSFLAPDRFLYVLPALGKVLTAASLLVLPGVGIYLVRQLVRQHGGDNRLQAGGQALGFVLGAHILVYLAALVFSISLLDASTPLNTRILSVISLAELILLAAGLAWLWQKAGRNSPSGGAASGRLWIRAVRPAVVLVCLGLAAFGVWDGVFAVQRYSQEGLGFAHRGWRESPALQALNQMPEAYVYSNRPTAIYLLTGQPTYAVPNPVDAVTAQARETYQADLDTMQSRIRSGEAILLLFDLHNSADPGDQVWYQDLTLHLPLLADYSNAVVYGELP